MRSMLEWNKVLSLRMAASIFACILLMCVLSPGNLAQDLHGLGTGVYLPTVDVLDNVASSRNIFSSSVSSLVVKQKYPVVKRSSTFLQDSKELYQELAQTAGISGSYSSITFSMDQSFKSVSKSKTETTSLYIYCYSFNSKLELVKSKLDEVPLSDAFLKDLRRLPLTISDPSLQSSWVPVSDFMRNWGSHFVSAVYQGAWIQQWSVAKSSSQYSQKDFALRACLKLEGSKKLDIDACAGFSSAEKSSASRFEMSDTLYVKGGTDPTRSKLQDARTEELLEQFMLEGSTSEAPVQYNYTPLWQVIRERFPLLSSEWKIARNLEAYYEGFKAFGCELQTSGGRNIQMLQPVPDLYGAHYRCVRMCRGCHDDDDCHIGGAGSVCYCYGPTCIKVNDKNRPVVQNSQSGSYSEDENVSCRYQVGVWCACRRRFYYDEPGCDILTGYVTIWDQSSLRDANSTAATTARVIDPTSTAVAVD